MSVLAVLRGGHSPEWQHRQALILAGTIWHNYDTNRSWYLEMLPAICFMKLPSAPSWSGRIRELSNLLQHHVTARSRKLGPWSLAVSRFSQLLVGGAPFLSGVLPAMRAVPAFQHPEHGCPSKRRGLTYHPQSSWGGWAMVCPHPRKLARDAFVLVGGWAGAQVSSLSLSSPRLCRSLELDVISLPRAGGHSTQHFQSLVSQIFKQREVIAILVTTCIWSAFGEDNPSFLSCLN